MMLECVGPSAAWASTSRCVLVVAPPGGATVSSFCSAVLLLYALSYYCRRVTNQLLQLMAVHRSSLRDVRLEWCCNVQGGSAAAGLSSAAGGAPVTSLPCFSAAALVAFLGACPLLRTLRLRHSAVLSSRFVQQLAGSCALLQLVALDQCDLAEVSQR